MSDPSRKRTTDGHRLNWFRPDGPVTRRLVQPLQAFLETEASSAILLLAATVLAIVWANSPFAASYERLWSAELRIGVAGLTIGHDLRGWVTEGLMTLFFFVVALEIKRELLRGELRERRAAILPALAAVGGMVVPAAVYLAFTAGTAAADGFGIAMPTDMVFALAVLTFVRKTPPGVKALLLALAIVDDLLSILLVAVAYSEGVAWPELVVATASLSVYAVLWRIHVRAVVAYVALAVVSWVTLDAAGVPPTLAGVGLALLTPASSLGRPSREPMSPLARAETFLLPWSSYVVVPLFALAVAGVDLSAGAFGSLSQPLGVGIVVSRVVGKPAGILLAAMIVLRVGARLPADVERRHLLGVAAVAGIPFTVSAYIAQLSLPGALLQDAMTAILVSAVLAGIVGWVVLRGPTMKRSGSTTRAEAE